MAYMGSYVPMCEIINMNMNMYENGIQIWNMYVFPSCFKYCVGKMMWNGEMKWGQLLKPLTVL